jgi:Arc/MetJ-type ribon-helix-helix transcriptional regulator
MGRRKREPATVVVLLDPEILAEIDRLVEKGRCASRGEFIKTAVYEKLEREKARETRQSAILYT